MTGLLNPEVVSKLNSGAVGVLATDTVYGLVCRADDQAAVTRLYKLKNREHKPGTIIAANIMQLEELGLKKVDLARAEAYWPNPVSVIIPAADLSYLTQGIDSLAVRIPANNDLHKLLLQTGPLLTSSANLPGELPASNIDTAKTYFSEAVDFYIDGGPLPGQNSSTIIRITDEGVEVIREGKTMIDERGRIV